MSSVNGGCPENPYVGPRPFEAAQQAVFFGRDRECRELADLLIAERVVLLSAPSGAGKTSLIRAGLAPRLRDDFDILPIARVGYGQLARRVLQRQADSSNSQFQSPLPSVAATDDRFVRSALYSWEAEPSSTKIAQPCTGSSQTLAEYLIRRESTGKPQLLIFDQFEELLTGSQYDHAAKLEFFRQLGEVLRRGRDSQPHQVRWALFAFREEYLASLLPYFHKLPGTSFETYRLDLLGPLAALDAIREPARRRGVEFEPGAGELLRDNLRRVRGGKSDQQSETRLGEHVEPVQLQVVCFRFWERLFKEGKRSVSADDVTTLADVDNALGGYYCDKLTEIRGKAGLSELQLRCWFGERLITSEGRRAILQLDDTLESVGLDAHAVQCVLDTYLVRKEEQQQQGISWLQLVHDRLIEPIRQDNELWFSKNLEPFQREATDWNRRGRPPELLLRGVALYAAERLRARDPDKMRSVDDEFLSASRAAISTIDALKLRYLRFWAYLATAAFVIVTAYALFVVTQANRKAEVAEQKRETATAFALQAQKDAEETKRKAKEAFDRTQRETERIATQLQKTQREAQAARDELEHLKSARAETDEALKHRLSAVLRLPMKSAAALATARTPKDAQDAIKSWENLFQTLGSKETWSPEQRTKWLDDVNTTIKSVPPEQSFPETTQDALARMTLRISQQYGRAFLKQLSTDEIDVFAVLREQLFEETVTLTGELARDIQKPSDVTQDHIAPRVQRFWQLYYGELATVEGPKVASAMVTFGKLLKTANQPEEPYQQALLNAAETLRGACEYELGRAATAL